MRTIGTPQDFFGCPVDPHNSPSAIKPALSRQGPMVRIHLPPAVSLMRVVRKRGWKPPGETGARPGRRAQPQDRGFPRHWRGRFSGDYDVTEALVE
jgi:hypothetical protein